MKAENLERANRLNGKIKELEKAVFEIKAMVIDHSKAKIRVDFPYLDEKVDMQYNSYISIHDLDAIYQIKAILLHLYQTELDASKREFEEL